MSTPPDAGRRRSARPPLLADRDACSGLLFVLLAALGLYLSADYGIGTATRMGTGYVPRLVCWVLLALGLVVIFQARLARGGTVEEDEAPDPPARFLPPLVVFAAVAVFGLTVRPLGLVVATLLLVAIGSFASEDRRLKEIAVLALVLVVGSALLFVELLGLAMPLWPRL